MDRLLLAKLVVKSEMIASWVSTTTITMSSTKETTMILLLVAISQVRARSVIFLQPAVVPNAWCP